MIDTNNGKLDLSLHNKTEQSRESSTIQRDQQLALSSLEGGSFGQ